MKLNTYAKTAVLTLGIAILATFAGTATTEAGHRDRDRDREWNRRSYHHSYYYHRHHPRGAYYRYYTPRSYVYYRGYRGYWEDRSGVRIFIRF